MSRSGDDIEVHVDLRQWDDVLAVRVQAVVLVVLCDLVEAAYAQVHLAEALLLEGLEEQACVPQRQIVELLLLGLQTGNQGGLLLFTGELADFEDSLVQVVAVVGADDEHPVPPAPLESMQLVFVREDGGVGLELLTFLRPVDEYVLIEPLNGEVDRLIERAFAERRR